MTQENSSGTQVVSTQSTKMPAQAKKIDVLLIYNLLIIILYYIYTPV